MNQETILEVVLVSFMLTCVAVAVVATVLGVFVTAWEWLHGRVDE